MTDLPPLSGAPAAASPPAEEILVLHGEDLVVGRRVVDRATVRVATVTRRHDRLVEEALTHQRVEVVHVPVGRFVDAVPPVREEGGLTILPVVEEVVVVERRLLLREEVHVRRVQRTEQHLETVVLRTQDIVVTRMPAAGTDGMPTPTDQQ